MSRWGRLAVGVFVFGWMNAVAQPCFMDMSMSPETTASAMHGEHSGHTMKHEVAEEADCGHCPPGGHPATGDCMTVALSACDLTPEVVADGRTNKVKPDELQDDTENIVSSVDPPPAQAATVGYRTNCEPGLLPAGPPLNVQYCVFLK